MAVLMAAATVSLSAAKEHVAERFEIAAMVMPDGSLEVVETITFRFTGGTFTTVDRDLPRGDSDGIEVIDAAMDGAVMPRGDDAGQVEIDQERRRARVTWRFAPTEGTHAFTVRYRYRGVVQQGEGEDWFLWRPFPSRFDYPIEFGTAMLMWPEGMSLRRLPDAQGPLTSTSPADREFTVTVADYRERDDDVRVTVRFDAGAFMGPEPVWQRDALRADRLAPAFMAAGAMILAALGLVLWLFFLRYRRDGREAPLPSGSVTSPPADLPAPIGGAITTGRVSVSWPQLFAGVFELARRGVLRIEEEGEGGLLRKRRFTLRRETGHAHAAPLRPHEEAILDALFKKGESEDRFDRALQRLGGRAGHVKKAMALEMKAAGLIDEERREGARAFVISGPVVMALALLVAVVLAATGMRLGAFSLFVPGALLVAGFVLLLIGTTFSTLTKSGLRAAREWRAYGQHLKSEFTQGRVPHDGEAIGRMLPYAAALGVLKPFGKALEKIDVRNLPAWLRTVDAAGGSAAMVAIIASGSHSVSHGTGGGAGGGGGVGGGGSSAH